MRVSVYAEPAVLRFTSELMPTAVAKTAIDAARFYASEGLIVACTGRRNGTPLYDLDLKQPMFLLLGGERRGITRSFLDMADVTIEIPYGRRFAQDLGTVASASIIGFEILRQRSS